MSESRLKERLEYLKSIAQTEIFTNWELLTFLALFIVLGYVFFPKGKIEKFLSSPEDTNYELSRIYLEKLLKISPTPQLLSILIEREIGLGNYRDALKTLDKYREVFIKTGKEEEYLKLRYKILKKLYFFKRDKSERKKIKLEMERILEKIAEKGALKDKEFVYREAVSMDMPKLALKTSEEIALQTGEKIWYRRALKLALALKKWNEALKIVNQIAEEDPKFLKEGLIISQTAKDKESFRKFAQKLIESGKFTLKDLKSIVFFELSQRNYSSAEEFCMRALKKRTDRNTVSFCLKVALWTKDYREVRRIIEESLNRFKNDREMLEEFLKVARMVNDRELQLKLADRLLQLINGENR